MKRNFADLPHSGASHATYGRPILSLISHSIEALDAGQPASVMLSIGNVGHAPALNTFHGLECLLVNCGENFTDDALHVLCELPLRSGEHQLDPGGCVDLHFSLKHLHKKHVAAINRGELLLLILVRLGYNCPHGNFHWSNICFQYDGRAITLFDERTGGDAVLLETTKLASAVQDEIGLPT